jgi:hypothetical protein
MEFWVYIPSNDSIGSIAGEVMAAHLADRYPDCIYFKAELLAPSSRYNRIRELEEAGILGRELCPEPSYWHWPVVDKEKLPVEFLVDLELFGEIRYY